MFFFFLFIKATALIKYLSFQKQSACCFRLEISLTTDSPNQRNNWYGNPHSQNTLPWPLFSWNGIVCPRCVFTQFWNFRETCFCETGNWSLMAKLVLSPSESWIFTVLKYQKTEDCQQSDWVWEGLELQLSRQPGQHLDCSLLRPWAEGPAKICPACAKALVTGYK